jgi:hypothetical protein
VYLVIYRTPLLDRLGTLRLATATRDCVTRFPTAAPVAAGLILTIAAEALGQVSVSIREPLRMDDAFVRRELVGRSDVASLILARHALDRGEDAVASQLLEQALTEVRRDADRARVTELLDHLARRGVAPLAR